MKFSFTMIIVLISFANRTCHQLNKSTTCFKGRLEVKGPCSNYTIKLLEGQIDTSMLVANWKNPITQKTYTNVFALESPCDFPSAINEGDEFYFVSSEAPKSCMVCLIYYPKPPKTLSIKVLDKPCL